MTGDYVITFHDGQKLRSLHPSVLSQADREAMEAVIRRQMMRLAGLEAALTEPPASPPLMAEKLANYSRPTDKEIARIRMTIPPPFEQEAHIPKTEAPLLTQGEMARTAGYTGDVCRSCYSHRLKRTGSCITCEDCGSNEGCG